MANSSYVFNTNEPDIQLHGIGLGEASIPSESEIKEFARYVKERQAGNTSGRSIVGMIAVDIRSPISRAAAGDMRAIRLVNYFKSFDLDPFKIAAEWKEEFPDMFPESMTEGTSYRLNKDLAALNNYLRNDIRAVEYLGNSSGGSSTDDDEEPIPVQTSGSSLPGMFGDIKPIYLIGGIAVVGALLLMR